MQTSPDPECLAVPGVDFDALMDAAGDIAARLDGDGRIVQASRRMRALMPSAELAGPVTLASQVAAPERA